MEIMTYTTEEQRRMCFINLLINLYNGIIKKTSAEVALGKVQMLLWALQSSLEEY